MSGRLAALGLLTLGLSLNSPGTQARADQIFSTNDPTGNLSGYIAANQADANQNLVVQTTNGTTSVDTNFAPGTTNLINDPFVIQQFDSSKYTRTVNGQLEQATLAEVVVSLGYEFRNTIQISFQTPSTATVTAQGSMELDLSPSAGHAGLLNIVNQPTFSTQKTLAYPVDTKNPNYLDPTPKIVGSTSAMGYFDAATLSAFSGKGTLSLPVVATAISSYTNSSGNGGGGSHTTASARLSVTYFYFFTPVPEPSSLVLTGLGGLGLCLVYRVRNRRRGIAAA